MMDFIQNFINNINIHVQEPISGIFLFFTAGLLSSLFPCYYPLIPITVGFLQKKGQNEYKIWKYPLIYWLGTLFLYFLLGIIASFTGILLSKIMQNGWFILFLGMLYLYLSFAMIDFISLEPKIFKKLEEKSKNKSGTLFTFIMGTIAGLAASACVSPALVSVLLFVIQISSTTDSSFFSVAPGVLYTTSYGMGLGFPFFLSGVLGSKLPKSGFWMNIIKYLFSFIIFIIAIYQIQKALLVFEIPQEMIYFSLLGIILFLVISYWLSKKIFNKMDIIYFHKIFVYFSLVFILVYSLIIIYSFRGEKSILQNESEILALNYGKYEYANSLIIYRSIKEAMEISKKENKPIFLDFYADWCTNCVEFSKLMKTDKTLQSILEKTIILKIYDRDPSFDYFASKEEFQELQIGLPFFVILTPEFKILYKTNYYKDFENFKNTIEKYYNHEVHIWKK